MCEGAGFETIGFLSSENVGRQAPGASGRRFREGDGATRSPGSCGDFRSRHVEASQPGELLNQDTFYWGTLKGMSHSARPVAGERTIATGR
ncbi:MAG: hypothetical protein ABJA82_02615, partial [Myxococcales bacterium]